MKSFKSFFVLFFLFVVGRRYTTRVVVCVYVRGVGFSGGDAIERYDGGNVNAKDRVGGGMGRGKGEGEAEVQRGGVGTNTRM